MVQSMGKPSKVMTPINQEAARLLREAPRQGQEIAQLVVHRA